MSRNGSSREMRDAKEKLSEMFARLGEQNHFQLHKLHTCLCLWRAYTYTFRLADCGKKSRGPKNYDFSAHFCRISLPLAGVAMHIYDVGHEIYADTTSITVVEANMCMCVCSSYGNESLPPTHCGHIHQSYSSSWQDGIRSTDNA